MGVVGVYEVGRGIVDWWWCRQCWWLVDLGDLMHYKDVYSGDGVVVLQKHVMIVIMDRQGTIGLM